MAEGELMKLKEALAEGRRRLMDAEIPDADLDAWYLLEFVTGISRARYFTDPDQVLSEEQYAAYQEHITRRSAHIPLQHITGTQEFMGLEFSVNENVLIPRQDTEILVEQALEILKRKEFSSGDKAKILDLCTGSGCILLSVLYYCRVPAEGTGSDLSEKALEVARRNAARLKIPASFIQGDLFESLRDTEERFDMILSNPPYIKSAEIAGLQEEVRLHDPVMALDGREDGLYFYRAITEQSGSWLREGGYLLFEIGYDQAEAVSSMMREHGFDDVEIKKDLADLDRVVYGRYSKKD